MSIERNQEINSGVIYRDTRTRLKKTTDWLRRPDNFRNTMLFYAGFCVLLPMLIIPSLLIVAGMYLWFKNKRLPLPIRYPLHSGAPDPSTSTDKSPKPRPGSGIEFLGNERRGISVDGGDELWVSDSDIRVHRLVMATTGGGKTNTLLSWMLNPLTWGSGFMYSDGKAQNTLWADTYRMANLMWRTDDLLILNYMMGGEDQFEDAALGRRRIKMRKSNTMNPFGKANNDTINQLLSAMMPKASGDGASWQSKAINMMAGVTQVSCYLRARREGQVSVKTLRDNMALPNIIKLSQRADLPEAAVSSLKAYLNVGLPGYSHEAAKSGKQQSQTCLDQHGYLSGQYTRTLGLLTETYGHIFMDGIPEIDMSDVVLNNRILIAMIPTLEMAPEQAANLGKIVVVAAKMMMAANLGSTVEGDEADLISNRPTNTTVPYEVVLDELGYYFADGIDLMFAQGRSLGIGLTASGQDFQAMAKDSNNKNQVESMIANTGLKVALKTEDPKETFEVFQKAAGEAFVTRVSGFEQLSGSSAFRGRAEATIEKQHRITLQEVRNLKPGDGVVLFEDKVIRASMFNMFADIADYAPKNSDIKLNTMLPIDVPQIHEISALCSRGEDDRAENIMYLIMAGTPPIYQPPQNPMLIMIAASVSAAAVKIPRTVSAAERGISLFVAARNALRMQRAPASKMNAAVKEAAPVAPTAGPLDFLNAPPFGVEPSNTAHGQDEEFGIERNARITLTAETQKEIADIVSELSDFDAPEIVTREVESVRTTVEAGCNYQDQTQGNTDEPFALNDLGSLFSAFDQIQKDLGK